jgi:hypothetical protein
MHVKLSLENNKIWIISIHSIFLKIESYIRRFRYLELLNFLFIVTESSDAEYLLVKWEILIPLKEISSKIISIRNDCNIGLYFKVYI